MHRIDHPTADTTTVPGKSLFTEGNPTLGTPATVVTDDWQNEVQEEIISVLDAAGITPTKGQINQLLLALNALFGSPSFVTPPLFDADTSVATTEFVQRALGNFGGYTADAANRVLTNADFGRYIYLNANNVTLTLPNPASVPNGAMITVIQDGTRTGGIVNCPGGVTINGVQDGSSGTSVSLMNRAKYEFVRVSATAYQMNIIGGTNTLAANGWQRFPSGLIIQWASFSHPAYTAGSTRSGTVNLPISFPTAMVYCDRQIQNDEYVKHSIAPSGLNAVFWTALIGTATGVGTERFIAIGY